MALGHHPLSTHPISAFQQGAAPAAEASPRPIRVLTAVPRSLALASVVIAAITIKGSPDAAPLAPAPKPIVVQTTTTPKAQPPIVVKGPGVDIFLAPVPAAVTTLPWRRPDSAIKLIKGPGEDIFTAPFTPLVVKPEFRLPKATIFLYTKGGQDFASPRPVVVTTTTKPQAQAPILVKGGEVVAAPAEASPTPIVVRGQLPPRPVQPATVWRGTVDEYYAPYGIKVVLIPAKLPPLAFPAIVWRGTEDEYYAPYGIKVVLATPRPLPTQPALVIRGGEAVVAAEASPAPIVVKSQPLPLPVSAPISRRGTEDEYYAPYGIKVVLARSDLRAIQPALVIRGGEAAVVAPETSPAPIVVKGALLPPPVSAPISRRGTEDEYYAPYGIRVVLSPTPRPLSQVALLRAPAPEEFFAPTAPVVLLTSPIRQREVQAPAVFRGLEEIVITGLASPQPIVVAREALRTVQVPLPIVLQGHDGLTEPPVVPPSPGYPWPPYYGKDGKPRKKLVIPYLEPPAAEAPPKKRAKPVLKPKQLEALHGAVRFHREIVPLPPPTVTAELFEAWEVQRAVAKAAGEEKILAEFEALTAAELQAEVQQLMRRQRADEEMLLVAFLQLYYSLLD